MVALEARLVLAPCHRQEAAKRIECAFRRQAQRHAFPIDRLLPFLDRSQTTIGPDENLYQHHTLQTSLDSIGTNREYIVNRKSINKQSIVATWTTASISSRKRAPIRGAANAAAMSPPRLRLRVAPWRAVR